MNIQNEVFSEYIMVTTKDRLSVLRSVIFFQVKRAW